MNFGAKVFEIDVLLDFESVRGRPGLLSGPRRARERDERDWFLMCPAERGSDKGDDIMADLGLALPW